MVEVALKAIAAVCRLKNVYVLDIHKQTYLYAFPIFQKMLDLLHNSCIFAINMGEDNGIFASPHFKLLAAKIVDGSLPLRRWFVAREAQTRVEATKDTKGRKCDKSECVDHREDT